MEENVEFDINKVIKYSENFCNNVLIYIEFNGKIFIFFHVHVLKKLKKKNKKISEKKKIEKIQKKHDNYKKNIKNFIVNLLHF